MLENLELIQEKYDKIIEQLGLPEIINDQNKYRELSREHKNLSPTIETLKIYRETVKGYNEAVEIVESSEDEELKEMAEMELEELKESKLELEEKLKLLLVPKDPSDDKNAIFEIRAGTGGDEAALFAADLFKLYSKYAEKHGWKTEEISVSPSEVGGFKEIIFLIKGENVYGTLKFEGGVHRVQRVPATETQGRIHTSVATVAVLPEAEDVDITIEAADLKIDVYRSSGPGGQSVNTTDSAVRITYLPTNLVVTCQDEKSQLKNRTKAMKVLKSRLLDQKQQEENEKTAGSRKLQVSTGDRSAKIRTYNFPEKRLTDHRINLTLYKLDDILLGNIDEVIDALQLADQTDKLAAETEK